MVAERIPIPELKRKLDTNKTLVVVDVREPKEIKAGSAIPGAIHIPMSQIEKRLGELPKDAEIRDARILPTAEMRSHDSVCIKI